MPGLFRGLPCCCAKAHTAVGRLWPCLLAAYSVFWLSVGSIPLNGRAHNAQALPAHTGGERRTAQAVKTELVSTITILTAGTWHCHRFGERCCGHWYVALQWHELISVDQKLRGALSRDTSLTIASAVSTALQRLSASAIGCIVCCSLAASCTTIDHGVQVLATPRAHVTTDGDANIEPAVRASLDDSILHFCGVRYVTVTSDRS